MCGNSAHIEPRYLNGRWRPERSDRHLRRRNYLTSVQVPDAMLLALPRIYALTATESIYTGFFPLMILSSTTTIASTSST